MSELRQFDAGSTNLLSPALWRELRPDSATWSLALAHLAAATYVGLTGTDPRELLLAYCVQLMVYAALHALRALRLKDFGTSNPELLSTRATQHSLVTTFVVTWLICGGMVTFFALVLVPIATRAPEPIGVSWASVAILSAQQAYQAWRLSARDRGTRPNIQTLLRLPFLYLPPTFALILVPIALGPGLPLLLSLVAVKLVCDALVQMIEQRVLYPMAREAAAPV